MELGEQNIEMRELEKLDSILRCIKHWCWDPHLQWRIDTDCFRKCSDHRCVRLCKWCAPRDGNSRKTVCSYMHSAHVMYTGWKLFCGRFGKNGGGELRNFKSFSVRLAETAFLAEQSTCNECIQWLCVWVVLVGILGVFLTRLGQNRQIIHALKFTLVLSFWYRL